MTEGFPGVRPAVISMETKLALDDYRTFRHVARNIYTFNLDANKMKSLVNELPHVVELVITDIAAFVEFLNIVCLEDK